MKALFAAAIAFSVAHLPCAAAPDPAPAKSEVTQEKKATLLVARILNGEFSPEISAEVQTKVRASLPALEIRFLNVAEASQAVAGDQPLRDAIKGLKEDHLVFLLRDERGAIHHRSIAKAGFDEGVAKILSDARTRQGKVVELLNAADVAEGEARLSHLAQAAEAAGPESFRSLYPGFTKELLAAPTGERKALLAKLAAPNKEQERVDAINRLHFDLSMVLRNLPPAATLEQKIAAIDAFIIERKLEGEFKQLMTMRKYLTYSGAGKLEEAMKALDEARDVMPGSELATRIAGFKQSLKIRMEKAAAEKNNPPPAPPAPAPGPPPPAPVPQPGDAPPPPLPPAPPK